MNEEYIQEICMYAQEATTSRGLNPKEMTDEMKDFVMERILEAVPLIRLFKELGSERPAFEATMFLDDERKTLLEDLIEDSWWLDPNKNIFVRKASYNHKKYY